jgi:hypothetical protein
MPNPINLPIQRYLVVLAVLAVALVLIHLVLNSYNYEVEEVPWLLLQLFELDEENNLPTWFSSFLLLNNAALLSLAAAHATRHKIQWSILAAGFLLLSIDEVAGLHETFHSAIDTNWTIYAGILVLVVGAAFVPFLLALPRRTAIWFMISGATFVSGALVVEYLSRDMEEESLHYALAVALEEGLEMAGALLFLGVNLNRLQAVNSSVSLKLT